MGRARHGETRVTIIVAVTVAHGAACARLAERPRRIERLADGTRVHERVCLGAGALAFHGGVRDVKQSLLSDARVHGCAADVVRRSTGYRDEAGRDQSSTRRLRHRYRASGLFEHCADCCGE